MKDLLYMSDDILFWLAIILIVFIHRPKLKSFGKFFRFLFPYFGLEKMIVKAYLKDIKNSKLSQEAKMEAVLSLKSERKRIRKLVNKYKKELKNKYKAEKKYTSDSKDKLISKDDVDDFIERINYSYLRRKRIYFTKPNKKSTARMDKDYSKCVKG